MTDTFTPLAIQLPRPLEGTRFPDTQAVGAIVRAYLSFYRKLTIAERDIEVSYNDVYKFYEVSVFRWSKCGPGTGSAKYRAELWEQTKIAMIDLFDVQSCMNSWRWPAHHRWIYGEDELETDNGQIPGARYFIRAA